MEKRTIKLEEAIRFAKENGYLLAVYKRVHNNFNLLTVCIDDEVPEDALIVVDVVGSGLDFCEFTTEDNQFCFRLHNTFNIPDVIPIIDTTVLRKR